MDWYQSLYICIMVDMVSVVSMMYLCACMQQSVLAYFYVFVCFVHVVCIVCVVCFCVFFNVHMYYVCISLYWYVKYLMFCICMYKLACMTYIGTHLYVWYVINGLYWYALVCIVHMVCVVSRCMDCYLSIFICINGTYGIGCKYEQVFVYFHMYLCAYITCSGMN